MAEISPSTKPNPRKIGRAGAVVEEDGVATGAVAGVGAGIVVVVAEEAVMAEGDAVVVEAVAAAAGGTVAIAAIDTDPIHFMQPRDSFSPASLR
jgi:hypothetical protein